MANTEPIAIEMMDFLLIMAISPKSLIGYNNHLKVVFVYFRKSLPHGAARVMTTPMLNRCYENLN
jgi:hypothetical protein